MHIHKVYVCAYLLTSHIHMYIAHVHTCTNRHAYHPDIQCPIQV